MTCEEVQKFIYIYLDGEMEDAERREMITHIAGCAACTGAIETERAVLKTIRARAQAEKVPEWFRNRVHERLRSPAPALPFFGRSFGAPLAALAAAAAFLLVFGFQYGGSIFEKRSVGAPPPAEVRTPAAAVDAAAFARVRPALRSAGLIQFNDRAPVRPGALKPAFVSFGSERLRHLEPALKPANGKRIYLVHGGSLSRPRLPGAPALPAGATYATSGEVSPLELIQAGYYDEIEEP